MESSSMKHIDNAGRALAAAFALLMIVTACGSNQYGSQSNFNFKERKQQSFDLPSPSPNSASALGEGQSAGGSLGTQSQSHTAAPTTSGTTLSKFQIAINADVASHPGFDPSAANVYKGAVIVFTNHDSKPHSVV